MRSSNAYTAVKVKAKFVIKAFHFIKQEKKNIANADYYYYYVFWPLIRCIAHS